MVKNMVGNKICVMQLPSAYQCASSELLADG